MPTVNDASGGDRALVGRLRFAVDTGGTFTDLIVGEADGSLGMHKAPTTPDDPVSGVIDVMRVAAQQAGETLAGYLGRGDGRAFLGGVAATWPLVTRAQQSAMPVVGFMSSGSSGPLRVALAAFEDGLKEAGYIAGQNVTIEYRFSEGQFDRFPGFYPNSFRRKASVIVTTSHAGVLAAKKATSTIPIVFSIGDDPVKLGIVPSLNRPGGNLTGVYQFTAGLEGKRLGLLHEMVPQGLDLGRAHPPELRAVPIAIARRAGGGCHAWV